MSPIMVGMAKTHNKESPIHKQLNSSGNADAGYRDVEKN